MTSPFRPPVANPDTDSAYSWMRLVITVLVGTVACIGTWSVIVVLPTIQVEFDTIRGGASLPYASAMISLARNSQMPSLPGAIGSPWPMTGSGA